MSVPETVRESASPWWQWSLKELTVASTLIAIFFAMMAYMGLSNGLFWTCVIASSVITVTCLICLPHGNTVVPGSVVALIMLLLCNPLLMFFSGVMALNGMLHVGMLCLAKIRPERWTVKQTLFRSVSVTLLAFAAGVCVGYPGYRKLESHRQQIQLADLSGRLEYESYVPSQAEDASKSAEAGGLPEREIPGESEFENEASGSRQSRLFGRVGALQRLHNGRIDMFVKSPGFGIGRFFIPSLEDTNYPVLRDFTFSQMPNDEFEEMESSYFRYRSWGDRITDERSLHLEGMMNFVEPDSWGLVIKPQQAFGFRPHGFTLPLQNMGQSYLKHAGLRLSSLQLISLHRFESPRVYVLEHLPRMDQLIKEDVPTRELTRFELASTKQLEDADSLVRFQSTPSNGLEMVGAIRAYQSCLECHNVRRGDMLGAFTYQFENAAGVSDESQAADDD